MSEISDELKTTIRNARYLSNKTLGELIDRYGTDAVVQALGVHGISHILGLDEYVGDYDEESDD